MANNAEYNDKQNVAAALVEYRELEFGRNYSIAGKNGYIGNRWTYNQWWSRINY